MIKKFKIQPTTFATNAPPPQVTNNHIRNKTTFIKFQTLLYVINRLWLKGQTLF